MKGYQSTSQQAYIDFAPKIGRKQKQVLDDLIKHPNQTNSEIANSLGWPINTVTPRVLELREKGKVKWVETRRCKITGKKALAWIPV